MKEEFNASLGLDLILTIPVIAFLVLVLYIGVFTNQEILIIRIAIIFVSILGLYGIIKNTLFIIRKYSFKIILCDENIEGEIIFKKWILIPWKEIDFIFKSIPGGGSTKILKIVSGEKEIYISSSNFGDEFEVLEDRFKEKLTKYNKEIVMLGKIKSKFKF